MAQCFDNIQSAQYGQTIRMNSEIQAIRSIQFWNIIGTESIAIDVNLLILRDLFIIRLYSKHTSLK